MIMPSGNSRSMQKTGRIVASVIALAFVLGLAFVPSGLAPSAVQASLLPTPKINPPAMTDPDGDTLLSRGKFLVARSTIADIRFQETVILLIGYNPSGATGLIINRPTKVPLADMLTTIPELKKRSDIVYYGGPVENERMFMLIRSDEKVEEADNLFSNVYVSMNRKTLDRMIDTRKPQKQFHVYSGYAGWYAGQLDREVLRGDWYVVSADADTIFEKKSSEIWRELFDRSSEIQVRNHKRVPGLSRVAR